MSSLSMIDLTYKNPPDVKDPAILMYQRSFDGAAGGAAEMCFGQGGTSQGPRALRGQGARVSTGGVSASRGDLVMRKSHMGTRVGGGGGVMSLAQHDAMSVHAANNVSSNNSSRLSMQPREFGVIEKMLHSYGFIKCHNRDCRLFFHFSELPAFDTSGEFDIGDEVEFQQGVDRRTNKPVAVSINRVAPPVEMNREIISEKPFIGKVLILAKPNKRSNASGEVSLGASSTDDLGRVTYEQNGETFFLSYSFDDIKTSADSAYAATDIKVGDQVEFYICTDERNSNLRARWLQKIEQSNSDVYTGVVCSLKENYGFIERADIVKEIFFHFSEYQSDVDDLQLGDDVEFNIQNRNNKEVAVNIRQLPHGTVVFEDVGDAKKRGKIQKLLKTTVNGRPVADPLSGCIVYETVNGPIEIPYGDRDQVTEHTLQVGDIVEFYIATDRRDKLQRATNISLVDVTFIVSGEKRECGFVASLREADGYIRCVDRDGKVFFSFNELLRPGVELKLQDELEFTVLQDTTSTPSRLIATRITVLRRGTIKEHKSVSTTTSAASTANTVRCDVTSTTTATPRRLVGVVEKRAGCQTNKGTASGKATNNMADQDPGIIMYDVNGTKQTIPYSHSAITPGVARLPQLSDQVEFNIAECPQNNTRTAVMVQAVFPAPAPQSKNNCVIPESLSFKNNNVFPAPQSKTPVTTRHSYCNGGDGLGVTGGTGLASYNGIGSTSSLVVSNNNYRLSVSELFNTPPTPSYTSITSSGGLTESPRPVSSEQGTPAGRGTAARGGKGKELLDTPPPAVWARSPVDCGIPSSGGQRSRSDRTPSVSSSSGGGVGRGVGSGGAGEGGVGGVVEGTRVLGYIATLKDSFGFIELANEDKEVFFHYRDYDGDAAELDVGDEIEFSWAQKTGKVSAENIRKQTKGTIVQQETLPGILEGKVVRGLRITNPDQPEYCGLIQLTSDPPSTDHPSLSSPSPALTYTYGVTGLVDKRDLPQRGDMVRFQQLATAVANDGRPRAVRILPIRKLVHARIDAIKGQIGVLNYETEDNRKLTFQLGGGGADTGYALSSCDEVEFTVGDEVEFAPIKTCNGRKLTACCVRKIGDRPRPERLISRLKSIAIDESVPKVIVIRQPRGPDSTGGFKTALLAKPATCAA